MITGFFVAFLGTVAFAILFQAPEKHYILCGISGGISWVVFLAADKFVHYAAAIFISAFILTIFSRVVSVVCKAPSTIFLITGIFPLVPGTQIYYTAYYLFVANSTMASVKGIETISTAGAISIGILFGSSIPQKLISFAAGRGIAKKR